MSKIFVETHGCSANLAESEMMMGILQKEDHAVVHSPRDADIIIHNACTVKGEDTSLFSIRKIKERFPDKKLIVSGCLTSNLIDTSRVLLPDVSFVNTHNVHRIGDVVDEVNNGNAVEIISRDARVKLGLPRIRKNSIVGIVPILNSCNNHCTFCSVWQVKGKLFSYPQEEIIHEVSESIKQGCKEIWLTSQDNGAYFIDKGGSPRYPSLLASICTLPGEFHVRFGMINPQHILPVIDEFIDVMKNEKMFKFLHIPVQSGSNTVLQRMDRGYTVEDFISIIEKIRKEIPDITFATDIICGFPGETEEQAAQTENLLDNLQFDVINISRFFPRKNTKAARMVDQLHGRDKKRRSRKITELYLSTSLNKNKKWIGWKGKILVDEQGKNGTLVGRNYAYKPVIINGPYSLGDLVNVEIINASSFDLKGKIISH